jgi:spoIIIJ-associated protein
MSPSESIETTAATIDQAISNALAQLGAEQDDVTIEVLSTPRSGVLGLGARQARVRVTKRAREEARSGVMSPPPAPPLRPTPPEMRRPEAARPEVRREPPRPEPGEPQGTVRSESQGPESGELARGAERGEVRRDQRGEFQGRDRGEFQPRDPNEPRPDLRNEAPREQRDQRREIPPPREPRRQGDEREQARGGPGGGRGDNRRDGGRNPPRPAPSSGRGNPPGQAADAASAADRGQPDRSPSNRTQENQVPSDQVPSDQVRSDQVEDVRDDSRGAESPGQERAREGGSRGRRGRGRGGRRQPDNAPPRAAPAPEPAPGCPQERTSDHDEDRDPFAAMDEAGNDTRKIADLQEQAREATIFLERLLQLMGEKATIEPAESDDPETLELNIKGDGSGILIGRHGQTLDAIEYMVNRLLARKIKDAAPISIDTESYRARRRRLLQRMALSKGEQAKREHVSVMIEPMPPRDRRIVHLALQDDPMITTRSTGDGFMRAIEIVPVDERRSPDERGTENRGRGRGRERDRDQDAAPALGEQGGFKHGQKRIV